MLSILSVWGSCVGHCTASDPTVGLLGLQTRILRPGFLHGVWESQLRPTVSLAQQAFPPTDPTLLPCFVLFGKGDGVSIVLAGLKQRAAYVCLPSARIKGVSPKPSSSPNFKCTSFDLSVFLTRNLLRVVKLRTRHCSMTRMLKA